MIEAAGAERYYSSGDGQRLFYRDFAPWSGSARLPVLGLPGLSQEQWLAYARRSYSDEDGKPRLDMDPMIGEAVRSTPAAAAPAP